MNTKFELEACKHFLEFLDHWVTVKGASAAFTFISTDGNIIDSVTYQELQKRTLRAAQNIRNLGIGEGDRVALVYPPGIDYIVALLGAMHVGALGCAIAYPRGTPAVQTILSTADKIGADLILTALNKTTELGELFSPYTSFRVRSVGSAESAPALTGRAVARACTSDAFIQLTSGSTGLSKALIVGHAPLIYNSRMLQERLVTSAESVFVSWLPHHHDLGLVVHILQNLFCGGHCVLLTPATVISQPASWLRAISAFRATITSAPNFAFQLCVDKIRDDELAGIDLSCLQTVINASEPVMAETLSAFATRFLRNGFESRMFRPSYGMAEATVFVSMGEHSTEPVITRVDLHSLSKGRIQMATDSAAEHSVSIVGCGKTCLEQEIEIFDPEQRVALGPNRIGEIWVAGANVLKEYMNDATSSGETFVVHAGKSYLRTGDLGFMREDGELYITGRIKDVVIVRGANYSPQDIEHAFEAAHPYIRKGFIAAFNAHAAKEDLTVVAALDRQGLKGIKQNPELADEICVAGRSAVLRTLGLDIAQILLVNPREIPITTSGKICRQKCKALHMRNSFEILYRKTTKNIHEVQAKMSDPQQTILTNLLARGEAYFKVFSKVAKIVNQLLSLDVTKIDPDKSLFSYGIDSIKMIEMHTLLEGELGVEISVVDLFDAPSFIDMVENINATVDGRRNAHKSLVLDEEVARYVEQAQPLLNQLNDGGGAGKGAFLLTGAAGFYGGYLLAEMLKQSDAKIYCLIRAADVEAAWKKLLTGLKRYKAQVSHDDLARIVAVVGDITQPKLGLAAERYDELADEVSLVLHCAASDNFYLPYSAVSRTNVNGTLETLRFCLHRRLKSFQHVSSCAAGLFDAGAQDSENYGLYNGYAQSKYVAEKVVVQLAEKGLPAATYRLGYLYRLGLEGFDDADSFETLMHAMVELKMVPIMDAVFDLTPVDYAAASVIRMALSPHKSKPVYTYYNPHLLQWADIVDYFKLKKGIRAVPLEEFVSVYQKYLVHAGSVGAKLLKSVVNDELDQQFNKMFRDVPVDHSAEELVPCPPCNREFVFHYLDDVLGRTVMVDQIVDEPSCV